MAWSAGVVFLSILLLVALLLPLLLRALMAQDMFLAGTIVLLLGILTVIGTLVSDLLLMWIDPRIRLGSQRPIVNPAAPHVCPDREKSQPDC
jgi:peptide/nickel transport system permease protein